MFPTFRASRERSYARGLEKIVHVRVRHSPLLTGFPIEKGGGGDSRLFQGATSRRTRSEQVRQMSTGQAKLTLFLDLHDRNPHPHRSKGTPPSPFAPSRPALRHRSLTGLEIHPAKSAIIRLCCGMRMVCPDRRLRLRQGVYRTSRCLADQSLRHHPLR